MLEMSFPCSAIVLLPGDAVIVGDWKLIKIASINPPSEFGWPAAPGEDTATTNYSVQCNGAQPSEVDGSQCTESFCLFNLADDPCEYNDLAAQYPKKVAELTAILDSFQPSAVESGTSGPCSPVEIIFEDTLVWTYGTC